MKYLALFGLILSLTACAGYRLGETKPASLAGVKTIAVPMFKNSTLHPKAEVLATSAVSNAIVVDGTYRLARRDQADAVLEGTLSEITYSPIRGNRYDTLLPEELANTVIISWKLRDARNPTKILANGSSKGTSQLFVAETRRTGSAPAHQLFSENLQTARNNALPDALEKAGESLVSRITNSF